MRNRLALLGAAVGVGIAVAGLGYRVGSGLTGGEADPSGTWTDGLDSSPVWLEIPVPDVEFQTAEGGIARLSDYAGQIVVLNFWGTWCPPCLVEIPHLIEVQGVLSDLGGTVVGPAVGSGRGEDVLRFGRDRGINYPLWLSDYDTAVGRFGAAGYPFTLLIDGDGFIRKQYLGPQTARTLLRDIGALVVREPTPAGG